MESKKTFGEYICKRRKERGLTQREFADQLYVTESAVSKWERGLSYPDVTLLRDICLALDITEHELLTASEDTEKRTAERLAEKYTRLTRIFRLVMSVLLGGTLLGCTIGSFRVGPAMFFIALAAVGLAGSLTLLPSLLSDHPKLGRCKWAVSLGSAVTCLELLLGVIALFGGDNQMRTCFPLTAACILFGAGLVFLPLLLPTLPLPPWLANRKASICCAVDTVLLALVFLGVSGWDWHFIAISTASVLFGAGFVTVPVYLRQLPLPEPLRKCKASLYVAVQALLLVLLFLAIYRLDSWRFPVSAMGTLLGTGTVFLPLFLHQMPLPHPWKRCKALLYLISVTALLILLLAVIGLYTGLWFFLPALPIALAGMALPWGLMGIIRYLPVNGWFRASLSAAWAGLWLWLFPWVWETVTLWQDIREGFVFQRSYLLRIPYDFSRWDFANGHAYPFLNTHALILMGLAALAVLLAVTGTALHLRKRHLAKRCAL